MDWVAIANLLVSSVSSLSSIVQAHNSNKLTKTELNKATKRIEQPLKNGGKQVSVVINHKLLTELSVLAETQAKQIINVLSHTDDIELIEMTINEARSRVCFYLTQIKQHNQGKLPTKRLQNLWLSHQCETENNG
ncbi:hypothetical protein JQC92_16880 [Shewanella sp. 202IG2-18]|uniref:hypothetical protein n=1 Tax=Parashewanella hymeniacidonis TaxID=2807618 RepID=UPI00195FB492|nr:hypothetical protein [Parashewanella hymeniacidonis]MBM7073686.1 hypothetical protein [Parashewanella hymeniacidonis]